ncbi:MAG TPA: MoaD/ThiS family protein [Fimbriimonadaceae bacterium]|nr:MoaD/ThiS family protein [Fimbriimonadaceae bacterium]
MKVKVRYYALFREKVGKSEEVRLTSAANAEELYCELEDAYGFGLDRKLVKCALNGKFQPLDTALQDGDEVVFIPPVAGG